MNIQMRHRTLDLLSEDRKTSKVTAKHRPRSKSVHSKKVPDYHKQETKMSSTKTISMSEVHRQASLKITLYGSQKSSSSPNDFSPTTLGGLQPFQARLPSSHPNVKLPESQAAYAWLDDSSMAQAFLEISENQDRPAVHSGSSPTTSENSDQPVSTNRPRRPTLDQRIAALPHSLNASNQSVSVGSVTESLANRKAERLPDVGTASSHVEDADEQTVFRSELKSQLQASEVSTSALQTHISSSTYLTELPNDIEPGNPMINAEVDVINFVVPDPDSQPLTELGWLSAAPSGSISAGKLLKGDVKIHVAAKLRIDARSFGLWYDEWPCSTEPSITAMGDGIPRPCRVTVNIMFDPYIRLIFGEKTHTLDYSHRSINKINMSVGMIRKEARSKLDVSRDEELLLYLQEKELVDDRISLRDTGLFSDKICQGLEPLYLRAETKIRYKTCIGTGDPYQKILVQS